MQSQKKGQYYKNNAESKEGKVPGIRIGPPPRNNGHFINYHHHHPSIHPNDNEEAAACFRKFVSRFLPPSISSWIPTCSRTYSIFFILERYQHGQ